jgi:hypothetical protein
MMTDHELDLLTRQVEKLTPHEQLLLIERIVALLKSHEGQHDVITDQVWDKEELAALLEPEEALTGREMVEQGYTGGWEDMGITDGAEWVNQQKAKRKARRKKKFL